jgi:hypothetical protein
VRSTSTLAALAALALAAAPARADGPSDVAQAKTYFNAGAQAYAAGKFPAAIQAFVEAQRLAPRPAILFSIAQAYRRQFYLDRQSINLDEAIRYYRQYVEMVPQGGRRADAAEALAELEPVQARLAPTAPAASPSAAGSAPTRLMVTSPTRDAAVWLDGKEAGELPLIQEVPAGKHTVRLEGAGYFGEEREVLAVEGGLVAIDVALRERPARVAIAAPDGAAVTIDGRPMGTVPLASPLELPSGSHLVTITLNGHRPLAAEVDLARGASTTVDAPLETTGQRKVSYVLLGAGAAGAIAGGVLTALALGAEGDAEAVLDVRASRNITDADRDEYDAARARRDDLRRGAGVALGAALALSATGALLHAFDRPSIEAPTQRRDVPARTPSRPAGDEPLELGAAPVITGDAIGALVSGRF